jgi:hypothetical protein
MSWAIKGKGAAVYGAGAGKGTLALPGRGIASIFRPQICQYQIIVGRVKPASGVEKYAGFTRPTKDTMQSLA